MPKYTAKEQEDEKFVQNVLNRMQENFAEYLIPEDEQAQKAFAEKLFKEYAPELYVQEATNEYLTQLLADYKTATTAPETLTPETMKKMYQNLTRINYELSLDNTEVPSYSVDAQFPPAQRSPEHFRKYANRVWAFLTGIVERIEEASDSLAGVPWYQSVYFSAFDFETAYNTALEKAAQKAQEPHKKPLMVFDPDTIGTQWCRDAVSNIEVGSDTMIRMGGDIDNIGFSRMRTVVRTLNQLRNNGNFDSMRKMADSFEILASLMTFLHMNEGKKPSEMFPEAVRTPELFHNKAMEMMTFMLELLDGDIRNYKYFSSNAVDEAYRKFRETHDIPELQPDAERAAQVRKELEEKDEKTRQAKEEEERQNDLRRAQWIKEAEEERQKRQEENKKRQEEDNKRREEEKKKWEEEKQRLEDEDRQRNPEKYEEIDRRRRVEENDKAFHVKTEEVYKKWKELRAREEELKTAGAELTKRLPSYEIPDDKALIEESIQEYVTLYPEWNAVNLNWGNTPVERKEQYSRWAENYCLVKEHPEQFKPEMYEELEYACVDLGYHRLRSDEATVENYLAVSAEFYALLKAMTHNMKDDKCYYNKETGKYYADVFNEAYSSYKGLEPVNFDEEIENEDGNEDENEYELDPAELEKEEQPVQNEQVNLAPAEQPAQDAPVQQEQPAPEQGAPVQPAPAQPQDVLTDALKEFEVAANAHIWGGGGHPTEFGNVRALVAAYQAPDNANRNETVRQLYSACRVYMDKHTDNSRTQENIGGQKTIGGRLRKQAIVQILRIMSEQQDNPLFADLESVYQNVCQQENRNMVPLELDGMENSLASGSKAAMPRDRRYSPREKAYAELKTAAKAFRDRQVQEDQRRREQEDRRRARNAQRQQQPPQPRNHR